MSVTCQDKHWTGRFTVGLEQKSGFANQGFSIKHSLNTLSGKPYVSADINGYSGPDSLPDNTRHITLIYKLNRNIIKSISWHFLCATQLLVAYKVTLTTRGETLSFAPYSWLPAEMIVIVGWLLKSYWRVDSPLFNPIQQPDVIEQQASQNHLPAIIVMMLSSGNKPLNYQPSQSSSQRAPQATSQSVSYFSHTLHSNSGNGNGDPQQHQHTLGLNCFVDPCHGVCQFRSLSDNRGPDECLQNSPETAQAGASNGQSSCPDLANKPYFGCIGYLDPVNGKDARKNSPVETFCDLFDIENPYDSGIMFDIKAYDIDNDPANSFNFIGSMSAETGFKDDTAGTLNDDPSMLRNDYVPRELTSSCQSALANHRRKYRRQKACDVAKIGNDGQTLSDHKIKKDHSRQKICDFTVIREDGLEGPCGRVCNNINALRKHKRKHRKRKPDDVRQVDSFSL
ncbi:hypothetical protein [Endozoicomonas sp. 8E]|uniref:hypothetical protein n=1 Tax=Endozoicomonas sp. 8E TaxID=3035692 RepID=UPI002939101B|nr:hypothetical protein [Endozoicomonas sp. 8E]WOG27111.1 hypothetical protein P6910_21550 [Endozoicomonas sp. 8E]